MRLLLVVSHHNPGSNFCVHPGTFCSQTTNFFLPISFFTSNALPTSDVMATNKTSHLINSALQLGLIAKAIRLIEVLSGDQTAAMACRFQNHTLQDSTTCAALFYTWGGSNNTKEILLDGEASKVRHKL